LYDRYGLDRSPTRDRAATAEMALHFAARDGLLRVPRKHASTWKGGIGFELVQAVERILMQDPERNISGAIQVLQETMPDYWGFEKYPDLEKRYFEARKVWPAIPLAAPLMPLADRWFEFPEPYTPRNKCKSSG
jgi:hypothetical protein